MKNYKYIGFALIILGSSCTGNNTANENAPIVLGDSSTIVTETDTAYLKSMFMPQANVSTTTNPVETNVSDTVKSDSLTIAKKDTLISKPKDTVVASKVADGLHIDFGENVFVFEKVEVVGKNNVKGNSASYTLKPGTELNNALIKSLKGKIVQITQQYETELYFIKEGLSLPLSQIKTYSSSWENLGKDFKIQLNEKKLQYTQASSAQLKKAADAAIKSARIKKSIEKKLLTQTSKLVAGQKEIQPKLKTVKWKIKATDDRNKQVSYNVRIDIP